jgi:hypothetical protein
MYKLFNVEKHTHLFNVLELVRAEGRQSEFNRQVTGLLTCLKLLNSSFNSSPNEGTDLG